MLIDQCRGLRGRFRVQDRIALRSSFRQLRVLHLPNDELGLLGRSGLCDRLADHLLESSPRGRRAIERSRSRAAVALGAIISAFDVEVAHEASDDGSGRPALDRVAATSAAFGDALMGWDSGWSVVVAGVGIAPGAAPSRS
jgi:hypothetical protein